MVGVVQVKFCLIGQCLPSHGEPRAVVSFEWRHVSGRTLVYFGGHDGHVSGEQLVYRSVPDFFLFLSAEIMVLGGKISLLTALA